MKTTKAQIMATIGPASSNKDTLKAMALHHMSVARFNFSWGNSAERIEQIKIIRKVEKEVGRKIPIVIDLPGPRIEKDQGHTYDNKVISALTTRDEEFIKFGVLHQVDYIALSFVGGKKDIESCQEVIKRYSGNQKVIAKIERKIAVELIDEIIAVTDAIMIARGDLGDEVPLEQIPFIQQMIIEKCKKAGKPVITATEMLFSMVHNPVPYRAEVTDVAVAILQGSDVVMLSEETAKGKYPVESVAMAEKIIAEAEKHMSSQTVVNPL